MPKLVIDFSSSFEPCLWALIAVLVGLLLLVILIMWLSRMGRGRHNGSLFSGIFLTPAGITTTSSGTHFYSASSSTYADTTVHTLHNMGFGVVLAAPQWFGLCLVLFGVVWFAWTVYKWRYGYDVE
jgi:formate hydrogenlyase subunit 3/multisubunit Na+/H+ antiporter MnhD subunit